MSPPLRHRDVLRRKAAQLACYVEIPIAKVRPWALETTTVVDAIANGQAIGRRTIKPWGDGERWFIELNGRQCQALGVDVGDAIDLALILADTAPPDEIAILLRHEPEAAARWQGMSPARQRMLGEHVRDAARPATRAQRARRGLGLPSA